MKKLGMNYGAPAPERESFLKNQKTPRSFSQFCKMRVADLDFLGEMRAKAPAVVRDRVEKKPASIFIDAGYRLRLLVTANAGS